MLSEYKAIFHSALKLTDEVARVRYLDEACGNNLELRGQVESLLQAHGDAQEFMQSTEAQAEPLVGPAINDFVGEYKLREKIGEGGMGVVYVAEQVEPVRRKVALKIIKPGMDTNEVIARFQAERQALALMDHPNIAKVFDGGATDSGRPYFVMELVRGIPITEFCDQACLDMTARLKLFVTTCQAIQHAHRRGVIHRDIKPSNVLVSLHDDQPVVKVIDFGVAKATNQRLTELSIYTQFQQIIGTPLYMSPEQAELSGLDIDTRTDVYSLGVLLYELLTGVTPFDRQQFAKATYDEMRRIIREEEPKKPSTRISTLSQKEQSRVAQHRASSPAKLSQLLKGELDWILTKALEKNRTRRYDSASTLADDVERYLRKEPIKAVAPSALYKIRKFVARQKLVAATAGIVLLSLLLGIAGTTWQAIRANQNAANARDHEAAAIRSLYLSEVFTAKRELDELNTKRAFTLVNKYHTVQSDNDFRGFEWRWLWQQFNNEEFRLIGHTAEVRAVRFSPDGKLVASGSTDGTVRLWDLETRRELWKYKGGRHCNLVDFSRDGSRLLASFYLPVQDGAVGVVWDISDPELPAKINHMNAAIGRFSPDDQRLFRWGKPAEMDLQGNVLHEFSFGWPRHVAADWSIAVTKNEIWDMVNDELLATLPVHTGIIPPDLSSAAISPVKSNMIVTGSVEGARVWDQLGRSIGTLPGTAGAPITAIDFSHAGNLVGVYMATGGVQIFDVSSTDATSWEAVNILPTFAGSCLDFSPTQNDLFVAGGEEGFLRGYRANVNESTDAILDHENAVAAFRFSPDSRCLSVGMEKGELHLWDTRTLEKLFEFPPQEVWRPFSQSFISRDLAAFSPDSRLMAIVGPQDTLSIRDIMTGTITKCQRPESERQEDDELLRYSCTEFSPDGGRLYATAAKNKSAFIEVWDLSGKMPKLVEELTRRIGHSRFSDSLDISPDSSLLAAGTIDKGANIYRLPQLQLIKELDMEGESGALTICFSPDGKRLATSGFTPNVAILWDTSTWQRTATLHHPFPVTHVSWSPDDKRLATSDLSAISRLWDVATGQLVSTFRGAASEFSPDGNTLAVGAMGSDYVLNKNKLGRVILHRAPPLDEIDASDHRSSP